MRYLGHTNKDEARTDTADTHRWTIFLTSAAPKPGAIAQASSSEPPPLDHVPGGGDDLSYMIKKVTFKLHETIPVPQRRELFSFSADRVEWDEWLPWAAVGELGIESSMTEEPGTALRQNDLAGGLWLGDIADARGGRRALYRLRRTIGRRAALYYHCIHIPATASL